jgi:uncharacterized protein (DUF1697 family)
MARFAVLLRGVNVGGNNKVPMASFREALTTAGFGDVRTLLASGNVVLSSELPDAVSTALEVREVIASTFGLSIDCLGVSATQVRACVEDNPLWENSHDGSRMLTTLSDTAAEVIDVPRGGLARLNGGDVVVAAAGDVHVVHQWCPEGISKTPALTEFVRFPKGAVFTGRNRNTLEKMLALF